MDGGARVAEVLRRNGVRFAFTLAGGHISPVLVGCKRAAIRVVDVRHEATAAFAADAVSRLTGVPGVAIVTAGPGVSNTVTAVHNALLAQAPLVLLGGATATVLRGRGALQDVDQIAMMRPHVKWLARPDTLREVVPAIEEAFVRATQGVPGPVFVELAVDLLYPETVVRQMHARQTDKPDKTLLEHGLAAVLRGNIAYRFARSGSPRFASPVRPQPPAPCDRDLDAAAALLHGAERPLLLLGSQVMLRPDRTSTLVEALERIGVPVYLSGMARGLLGKEHRLLLRHRRREALAQADVVLLAGVPNDFRLDYGAHVRRAAVIGVNLDPGDLRRNRRPELGVLADPCALLCRLADVHGPPPPRPEWLATLARRDEEREREIDAQAEEPCERIHPLRLCRAIERHLGAEAILVGDGGDFVSSCAYALKPRGPRGWLDPGVFGTLGVGAGFALGAKLVRPEADVWLLWGDGAAGFGLIEHDTFNRHRVPVISVIGNDAGWTQIERDQVALLHDDVGCRLRHADYHAVAAGCGSDGLLLGEPAEIDAVLAEAVRRSRQGRPVCVNALIGRSRFREGSVSI